MTNATDVVAYTYNAGIYCPACIAKMFKDELNDSENIAPYATTEQILELVAAQREIDYDDPYSYDSDNFPKVVFSSQANDGDWEHCGNFADPKFEDVCEKHIDHDPSDCQKWRGIEERGPDYAGHEITWSSSDYEFSLTLARNYADRDDGKIGWSYWLHDNAWSEDDTPIFEGDDFATPAFYDAPEIVGGLLGFLSLQPGDTDAEYFEHYTERQTEWMEARAETLDLVRLEQFDE